MMNFIKFFTSLFLSRCEDKKFMTDNKYSDIFSFSFFRGM